MRQLTRDRPQMKPCPERVDVRATVDFARNPLAQHIYRRLDFKMISYRQRLTDVSVIRVSW